MTLTVEKISWRAAIQLSLPKEHGSWSLALEPVAFGLLVAPSAAGGALAVAALAGFFLRRPLRLALRGRADARQVEPLILSLLVLATLALGGLLLAAKFGGVEKLWPLLPAVLAGLVFVWADSRNEAREGMAEVAGAVAFGLLPAALAALAGWNVNQSLALTAMSLTRSVPTVLTVRTCLRLAKGKEFSATPSVVAVVIGIVLMAWLAALHLAPWVAVVFAVFFALRTMWLLLWRPQITARKIGITEAVLGGLLVLVLALTWKSTGGW